MDKFEFVALMLFAIQRNVRNYSVVKVLELLDNERLAISVYITRSDYLESIFCQCYIAHLHGVSYGKYDKYFDSDDERFNRDTPQL